jgi:hypothetical protein
MDGNGIGEAMVMAFKVFVIGALLLGVCIGTAGYAAVSHFLGQ